LIQIATPTISGVRKIKITEKKTHIWNYWLA